MASFTAQYRGDCAECGNELKDTECKYQPDGTICHVRCPADALPGSVDRSTLCPTCFTIPCVCDR